MSTEQWHELKNAEKTDPAQLLIDYKETFGSEAGKRVLRDLMNRTTVFAGILPRSKPIDIYQLIWDEAQRNFFVYILNKIHQIPKEKERKLDNG